MNFPPNQKQIYYTTTTKLKADRISNRRTQIPFLPSDFSCLANPPNKNTSLPKLKSSDDSARKPRPTEQRINSTKTIRANRSVAQQREKKASQFFVR